MLPARLRGHGGGVTCVCFDENGRRLFSGGLDRTLRIWDFESVEDLSSQRTHRRQIGVLRGHGRPLTTVTLGADGQLISGAEDGTAKIWLPDIEDIPQLRGHTSSVVAADFLHDGRHLVSGGGDGRIIVWDTELCIPVAGLKVDDKSIGRLACRESGGRTVVVATTDNGRQSTCGHVLVWDLDQPSQPVEKGRQAYQRRLQALAVSESIERLAAGGWDGEVQILRLSEGCILSHLREIPAVGSVGQVVTGLAFLDRRGYWLATACASDSHRPERDRGFRIWNTDTGEPFGPDYGAELGTVASLLADPDKGLLLAGLLNGDIALWRIHWESEGPRLELRREKLIGHTDRITKLAFHPREPRLASGSWDGTIRIWDTKEWVQAVTLHGHFAVLNDLSFDSNGTRLVSASAGSYGVENTAWLWESWESGMPHEVRQRRAAATRAYAEVRALRRAELPLDEMRRRIQEGELSADVRRYALELLQRPTPPR